MALCIFLDRSGGPKGVRINEEWMYFGNVKKKKWKEFGCQFIQYIECKIG